MNVVRACQAIDALQQPLAVCDVYACEIRVQVHMGTAEPLQELQSQAHLLGDGITHPEQQPAVEAARGTAELAAREASAAEVVVKVSPPTTGTGGTCPDTEAVAGRHDAEDDDAGIGVVLRRKASHYAGSFGCLAARRGGSGDAAPHGLRASPAVLALAWFRANQMQLLAGLTTALAAVPTSVAFSFLAAATPQVGLHGSWLIGLVAATLGGRTGPIYVNAGAVAVVIAPLVRHLCMFCRVSETYILNGLASCLTKSAICLPMTGSGARHRRLLLRLCPSGAHAARNGPSRGSEAAPPPAATRDDRVRRANPSPPKA